jgi:hypothetical protein
MTTPNDGDALCGIEGTVSPAGWFPEAGWKIVVEAGPTPNGPWMTIATTTTATSAVQIPDKNGSVENYYSWNAGTVSLAPGAWGVEDNVRATYIRSYSPPTGAGGQAEYCYSFDSVATSPLHEDWYTCASNKWNAEGQQKFYQAVMECASGRTPLARVTAPLDSTCPCTSIPTIGSDVTISSSADLAPLRCAGAITGALTVKNGAGLQSVSLPQLKTIGGDLSIDFTPVSGTTTARTINIPALNSIAGNVTVTGQMPAGATTAVNVALPAMASLGGSLSATFTGGGVTLSGLAAVATLNKDLQIDLGGDTGAGGFLSALTEVKGATNVTVRANATGLLPALAKVDGTFSLAHTGATTSAGTIGFGSLTSVGGDLDFNGLPWSAFGTTAFGKLASVTGTLRLEQSQLTTFDVGVSTLALGNLEIGDDPVLLSLPIRNVKVSPSGDITIVNDPKLPTCAVSNFLDAQTTAGWNGTFAVDGTDDNATCP